jgi:hypothetical protein
VRLTSLSRGGLADSASRRQASGNVSQLAAARKPIGIVAVRFSVQRSPMNSAYRGQRHPSNYGTMVTPTVGLTRHPISSVTATVAVYGPATA